MGTSIQILTSEEEEIISRAYKNYYTKIYTYVYYSIGRDRAATEDLVSDIFALACEKIGDFAPHENQAGWLYKTAQNKIKETRRKLKRRAVSYEEIVEEDKLAENSDYGEKETRVTIQGALTPEEHSRFLRYFIWGYSLQEMAELEGITKNNMSVRLSRLRDKLKDELRTGL